jgi:hypothetical protein
MLSFTLTLQIIVERKAAGTYDQQEAVNRVNRPSKMHAPQTISTTPTNGARISGAGMPILMNRPTPTASGKRNFCIPSERKTAPTISRIKMSVEGNFSGFKLWRNFIGILIFQKKELESPTVDLAPAALPAR